MRRPTATPARSSGWTLSSKFASLSSTSSIAAAASSPSASARSSRRSSKARSRWPGRAVAWAWDLRSRGAWSSSTAAACTQPATASVMAVTSASCCRGCRPARLRTSCSHEVSMKSDDDDRLDDVRIRLARAAALFAEEIARSRQCVDDARATLELATRAANSASVGMMDGVRQPRRILIVEDNVDAATALQRGLSAFGYLVEAVHDPVCALVVARYFAPDVALLDLDLPDIDGWSLAEQLRNVARPMYLIAVTGYGQ